MNDLSPSGVPPRPDGQSPVGRVSGLFRYPVKSLGGETLEELLVEARGVVGDRLWAVRDPDGKLGSGKSTRRFRAMPGLLHLSAAYDGEVPVLTWPDGSVRRGDDPAVHQALSDYVGRPVRLSREAEVSHFDDGPLHLVTTSAMATLADAAGSPDVRRLRPNLVVDTGAGAALVEDAWIGRRLAIGDQVVLKVVAPMPRCVMVNHSQPGLAPDPGMFGRIVALNDGELGVLAEVLRPGRIAQDDEVRLASR